MKNETTQSGDTGAKGALPWVCIRGHLPWALLTSFPHFTTLTQLNSLFFSSYFSRSTSLKPLFSLKILGSAKDPFYIYDFLNLFVQKKIKKNKK